MFQSQSNQQRIPTPPHTSRDNRSQPNQASSSSSENQRNPSLPDAPKYFNDVIFKIHAFEGYIATSPDHVSFRKGQYFYALSYNEETECYFVSTQYATPFARTAVCGFVPERFFETVSLNGKDPPHPPPAQYKKMLAEEAVRKSQQGSEPEASSVPTEGSITQNRLRSSKSVGNLIDKSAGFEDDQDSRTTRRDLGSVRKDPIHQSDPGFNEHQHESQQLASQANQSQQQQPQRSRGRSLSMRTLRKRGKSNPPVPDFEQDDEPPLPAQPQQQQANGSSNNIVIPPRRTFLPDLWVSNAKPGTSQKKKKEPKAFQTLDRSFRLFNFSTWSERPPQTSKTPGAPTTAAGTSTQLRHETPITGGTPLSPTSIPGAPAGMGKPLPMPPIPSAYIEAVQKQQQAQQQQAAQQQNQQPHPQPPSVPHAGVELISANIVEAMKQAGPINLTRFVITVTLRSATPGSQQRITTVTKSYEDFHHFHQSISSRFSPSFNPSNKLTGYFAGPASAATPTIPDFPPPITNVAELRRRFLLDARLQSQMGELNAYMAQLIRSSLVLCRALEGFLVAPTKNSPGSWDEGMGGFAAAVAGQRSGALDDRVAGVNVSVDSLIESHQYHHHQQQQGLALKSRMRSKSEAPFLAPSGPLTREPGTMGGGPGTGTGTASGSGGGGFFSTLRRSKSRTRAEKAGMDGPGSLKTAKELGLVDPDEMGGGSANGGPMSLNKIMTALRNGGGGGGVTPAGSARLDRSAAYGGGGSHAGGGVGGYEDSGFGGSTPQLSRSTTPGSVLGQQTPLNVSTPNLSSAPGTGGFHYQQQQRTAPGPPGGVAGTTPITPGTSARIGMGNPGLGGGGIGMGKAPQQQAAAGGYNVSGSSTPPQQLRSVIVGQQQPGNHGHGSAVTPSAGTAGIGGGGGAGSPYAFRPPSPPSPIAHNFASEVMSVAGIDVQQVPSLPRKQSLPSNHPQHQQSAGSIDTDYDLLRQEYQDPAAATTVAATAGMMSAGWNKMMARLGDGPGTGGGGIGTGGARDGRGNEGGAGAGGSGGGNQGTLPIRARSTSLGWDATGGGPPNNSHQHQTYHQQDKIMMGGKGLGPPVNAAHAPPTSSPLAGGGSRWKGR
ncbi:hypothetical protein HDU96_006513 [Phlyctochytrium bullatum]|nr:hypothetical protein HDU96_006513 [Phlyctochytrium bullatum]